MNSLHRQLDRFGRRVRLARLWRGLWGGLLIGACLASVLVVLDVMRAIEFPPNWGIGLAGAFALIGASAGFLWRVDELAVARSVDRRAGLEDRASTAIHKEGSGELFAPALESDAQSRLAAIQPKSVYPLRFGTQQASACLALALLAVAVTVNDRGLLLSPSQKAAQKELQSTAAQVQRIVKDLESGDGAKDREAERKLAAELRKFGRDLERGKYDREDALQQAEKLAQDAKKLTEQRLEKAGEKMEQVTAKALQEKFEEAGGDLGKLADLKLDTMEQEQLRDLMQKSGADQLPSDQIDEQTLAKLGADNTASQMMRMSEAQKQKLAQEMAKAQQDIQQKLEQGNLSQEERQKLEQQAKTMQELMKKMELSDDVKKALQELQNMKEYKEMQELMQKMQQAQQQMEQGKPLSDEQIAEMQKQAEQLAEMMKDPQAKAAMKQAISEMVEQLKQGNVDMKSMQQMMAAMGMDPGDQTGGNNQGGSYQGEGENPKGDPMELEGKGNITAVRGERNEQKGTDAYTEIKAPTMVGSRTSVPYGQVLPGYRKTAESAVNNNKVKGKHKERVKEYFEQLSGGKGK
ncbi:MAG: hypothetical protein JNM28_07900 [Armatimonadetes bacterium]|nr:hypothetical protein [Armatimonadota bacterium]